MPFTCHLITSVHKNFVFGNFAFPMLNSEQQSSYKLIFEF